MQIKSKAILLFFTVIATCLNGAVFADDKFSSAGYIDFLIKFNDTDLPWQISTENLKLEIAKKDDRRKIDGKDSGASTIAFRIPTEIINGATGVSLILSSGTYKWVFPLAIEDLNLKMPFEMKFIVTNINLDFSQLTRIRKNSKLGGLSGTISFRSANNLIFCAFRINEKGIGVANTMSFPKGDYQTEVIILNKSNDWTQSITMQKFFTNQTSGTKEVSVVFRDSDTTIVAESITPAVTLDQLESLRRRPISNNGK